MTVGLEVIAVEGEYRIDSRLVAESLGIEHKHFIETLRTYQIELEELGTVPFETAPKMGVKAKRGGDQPKYALLNEDQAIFAATLSRNTRQVVDFKLRLTKAFSVARKQQHRSLPQINSLWEQRALLFNQRTHIPEGYWCVFNEIAHVCWGMEFRGEHLQEDAVPDISVGRLWMKEVRRLGLDERKIQQYPHHYPDKRGIQYANIYPHAWLGAFRDWLQRQYLKEEFLTYVHKHAITLQPSAQKQLPPGGGSE